MKNLLTTVFISFLLIMPFTSQAAEETGLLDSVTEALGVSEEQGMGGLGSIFDYVKENVSADKFSSIASSVPGMDKYLSAIPGVDSDSSGSSSSGLGGLLEKAGEYSDTAKAASKIQKQFEALGLSTEKIGQYANVAMDYLGDSGDSSAVDALKDGLSGLL